MKQKTLETVLKNFGSLAVAFSGGVDSTFLLAAARNVFGDDHRLVAITAVSPIHPAHDIDYAKLFARENKIRHILVHSEEIKESAFLENPPDRCYICKKIIFNQILDVALNMGIESVAHGVNVDDGYDYRPGLKAAEEMHIAAPLLQAGLTKKDIRQLSKQMGLATWDKPSSGCLATRIPYGEAITLQKLKRVESAEAVLADMGFKTCRIRNYGEMAKIEVPSGDIEKLLAPAVRNNIITALKKIGFLYVTIDMEGYQSGRLNRSVMSESNTL